MPSSFPCSPVNREWSWKKTLIEKKRKEKEQNMISLTIFLTSILQHFTIVNKFIISFLFAKLSFCWFYLIDSIIVHAQDNFYIQFLMNILRNLWDFDTPIFLFFFSFFTSLWQAWLTNRYQKVCLCHSLFWIILCKFQWIIMIIKLYLSK